MSYSFFFVTITSRCSFHMPKTSFTLGFEDGFRMIRKKRRTTIPAVSQTEPAGVVSDRRALLCSKHPESCDRTHHNGQLDYGHIPTQDSLMSFYSISFRLRFLFRKVPLTSTLAKSKNSFSLLLLSSLPHCSLRRGAGLPRNSTFLTGAVLNNPTRIQNNRERMFTSAVKKGPFEKTF